MAKYIDFVDLKERFSILDIAELVNLEMKKEGDKYRASCPRCDTDDPRSIVITPAKGVFYCHAEGKGGDLISLAAHVEAVSMREAAEFIHHSLTVPEKMESAPKKVKGDLKPLSHLAHNHELVEVIGFDVDDAEQLGIGYAKKGLMQGTVAIPLRTEDGVLVGYIGVTDGRLPKSLKIPETNVVEFPKRETA